MDKHGGRKTCVGSRVFFFLGAVRILLHLGQATELYPFW